MYYEVNDKVKCFDGEGKLPAVGRECEYDDGVIIWIDWHIRLRCWHIHIEVFNGYIYYFIKNKTRRIIKK